MADMRSAREQALAAVPGPNEGGSVYSKQQELEVLMLTALYYIVEVFDDVSAVLANQAQQQAEMTQLLTDQKAALADLRAMTAQINKVSVAEVQTDAELQKIVEDVIPNVAAILFGWGGNIHQYPAQNNNSEVQMSDVSFSVSSSGESGVLTVLDAAGEAFTPDPSLIAWTESSNGAVITLTVAADKMSATATPVAIGTSTVTITVTNADGTPVDPYTATVTVTADDAASLSVTWSAITQAAASATAPGASATA